MDLTLSSLVFTTNILSTWYYGDSVYCILFCGLTITSIFFHTYGEMSILDKMMVFAVVTYGGYKMYQKWTWIKGLPILATFLVTVVLFFYGYWCSVFCYHPDKSLADFYHGLLHIISSIGHHLIIFYM